MTYDQAQDTQPFRFPAAVLGDLARLVPGGVSVSALLPPGQGLWDGSHGLHPHPLSKVDLERLKSKTPQEWPAQADTRTRGSC